MKKTVNFLKKHWLISGIAAVIIIVVLYSILKPKSISADTLVVHPKDFAQQISVSGTVISAQNADLNFADQGRIATVNVKTGDSVSAGEVLASLDTSDLEANLKSAEAALVIAKANTVTNTINLSDVTTEQNQLVQNAYQNLLSNDLTAASTTPNGYATNGNIQAPIITGTYTGPEGEYDITTYSSSASSGLSWNSTGLETSSGAVSSNTPEPLGTHGLYIQFPGAGPSYIGTTWVVEIPNKRSANYTVNENAYVAAEAARDTAIANAKASLGSEGANNSVAEAQVEQAQASVDAILAQIKDREIIAPFDGVVTNVNATVGQTSSSVDLSGNTSSNASASDISIDSVGTFQIQSEVPEVYIANLQVGDTATTTLDAYGPSVTFPAKVIMIDPARTVVNGVSNYKTTLQFLNPDPRIRAGMTATVLVTTSDTPNALVVPAGAVYTKNGSQFVQLEKDKKVVTQQVTTGTPSAVGEVQILSGLNDGDVVVLNPVQ